MRVQKIAIVLSASLLIPFAASTVSVASYSVPNYFPKVPSIGFSASDNSLIETQSNVMGLSYAEGATSGLYERNVNCTSVDDPACAGADTIAAKMILLPCSATVTEMCVQSLEVSDAKGVLQKASLGYELPGQKYPASKLRNSPAGGTASVWNVKGSPNSSGSDEYEVSVDATFQNYQNKGCTQFVTSPCGFTRGFRARVLPIDRGSNFVDFAPGARVAVMLRIDNLLTGFLFGRMKNVTLDLTPLSSTANLLRVEADPIDVPKIYAYVAKSDLSKYPKIVDYWKVRRQQLAASDFTSNDTVDTGPSPEWAMGDFTAFEDLVKSGPLVTSIWRFGTQSGNGTGSKCFDDKSKLQGLVTTNAPTYLPNPPAFENGELAYKVAGAHYLEDGVTLFKGSYDLVLRSDFARCLYGFTNAPIQAKISVVSTDGSTQDIATESLREDAAREWLYLSAKNFTFSSPTIRVKLSQAIAVEAKPTSGAATSQGTTPSAVAKEATPSTVAKEATPSTVAKKSTAKQITVTCVKGKTIKKVTGTSPSCPVGYKKK